ncbi:MAG: DUF1016 family protein [Bacilli bacterium]|nr:DUF1016 family protein [Bacilli bacterium]
MNYYVEIKNKLIDNEIYIKVKDYSKERNKVITYYEVGKLLSSAGKHYGENIIGKYAQQLQIEVGRKYDKRTLFRIRQFYVVFSNKNVSTMWTHLTWSHNRLLLRIKNPEVINYYIITTLNNNLSVRELEERIKNRDYERLPDKTKKKLIENKNTSVQDLIKNPIIIRNPNNIEVVKEKVLQRLILEDIDNFLKELGDGFSYIENEYKIKIGFSYNYIDLLLFNYKYNCFVVVELKINPLKKEYIGQIKVYMNYIDNHLRNINQDKTIGIIICKHNNTFIMEYCSDKRILSKEYRLV